MKNLAYIDLCRLLQPLSEFTHSVWSIDGEGFISYVSTTVPLPGRVLGSNATLKVMVSLEDGIENGAVARGMPSVALDAGQMTELVAYLKELEAIADQNVVELED